LTTLKDWLEAGTTRKAACAAAGISKETFYNWVESKPGFLDSVIAWEAEAERRWIRLSEKERPGNSIKLLAKRFRDEWGDRLELSHSGTVAYEVIVFDASNPAREDKS
jgi:AcrR family transcriptional regulator